MSENPLTRQHFKYHDDTEIIELPLPEAEVYRLKYYELNCLKITREQLEALIGGKGIAFNDGEYGWIMIVEDTHATP